MKNLRSKSNQNTKDKANNFDLKNVSPFINSINENSLVKLILSPETLLKNLEQFNIDSMQSKMDKTTEMPIVETSTIPMKPTTTTTTSTTTTTPATTIDVSTNEIEMNNSKSKEFIDHDINNSENYETTTSDELSMLNETAEILSEIIEELINDELINESIEIKDEASIEKHSNEISDEVFPTDSLLNRILSIESPSTTEKSVSREVKQSHESQSTTEKSVSMEVKHIHESTSTTEKSVSLELKDSLEASLSKDETESETIATTESNDVTETTESEENLSHDPYDHDHSFGDESQKIEIYALPETTINSNEIEHIDVPDDNELSKEEIISEPPNLTSEIINTMNDKSLELTTSAEMTAESSETETESSIMNTFSAEDSGPSPVIETDLSAIDSPELTLWPNAPAAKLPKFPKTIFKKVPPLFRPSALSSRRSAIDDSLAHFDFHSLLKQMRKFRPQSITGSKSRQSKRAIGDEGTLDNIIRPLDKPSVASAPVQMQTPLQSYEHYFHNSGQSSLEQAEQFEKGLQRIVQFVQIAAHIDSYLTSRFKSGIKTIAKIMESDEEESSSSRRLRRYSF